MAEVDLLERVQRGEVIDSASATANDSRQQFVGSVQVILYLVTAILFLQWTSIVYKNLTAISVRKPSFTPGWAIGSWFVPFLNLVRPYQIIRETWWVSSFPTEADNAGPTFTPTAPVAIKSWWAVYLLSGFLGQAIFRMTQNAETLPALLTVSQLQIASDVIGILSAGLALKVVRIVSVSQDNAAGAPVSREVEA